MGLRNRKASLYFLAMLIGLFVACSPITNSGENDTNQANEKETTSNKEDKPQSITDCLSGKTWKIEFGMSGGFAGKNVSIELDDAGTMKSADHKKNLSVTTSLPSQEIEKIDEILVQSCPTGDEESKQKNCNDCFTYTLNILVDDVPMTIELNEMNLTESGLEKLVKALTALSERAQSGEFGILK